MPWSAPGGTNIILQGQPGIAGIPFATDPRSMTEALERIAAIEKEME